MTRFERDLKEALDGNEIEVLKRRKAEIEKLTAEGKACKNACIGCKKCELNCSEGAIKVVDNLSVIDYSKCSACGKCAEVCPTHCIKLLDLKK